MRKKSLLEKFRSSRKAQAGVMGLIFLVILIVGVGIPLTQQVIDTSNLSGITATVVGFIPVFLALAVLAAAARMSGLTGGG
ncbi:hypothetical protein LCGC14_0651220 [marine sediment metagenome]|uniref:Uncharacterized protein n=1 Tax=marine sediment metagenome TaxID=412755 RepID=A0A0F9U4P8_9ZZZZ